MVEPSAWHPHATWKGFAPSAGGSLSYLDARGVEAMLADVADLPFGTVRFSGIEGGSRQATGDLLGYAVRAGLDVEVALRGPVDERWLDTLCDARIARISIPVEGPDAETHDRFRGVEGDLEHAVRFLGRAHDAGAQVELRTTLHPGVASRIGQMAKVVAGLHASRWLVLAPVQEGGIDGVSVEPAVMELAVCARVAPFAIVTQYAPFFVRLCEGNGGRIRSERNGLCVLPSGEVTPDPRIPLRVGHMGRDRLCDLFDDHPLLRALRDPDAVEGKCGRCALRAECGGSRARALSLTGNLFASDPACSYGT